LFWGFVYEESVIPVAYLPGSVLKILKEAARHVLRRPVVGIAAIAALPTGKIVLIRRADTQTWGLPGGTLEWGETLTDCIARELEEEAGVHLVEQGPVLGVYSGPDRDPRFHGVTVVVHARVREGSLRAGNPLEISEVGAFAPDALPTGLAFGMDDAIRAWRSAKAHVCE
jgi:8-oxo-dGTP diphosphatase